MTAPLRPLPLVLAVALAAACGSRPEAARQAPAADTLVTVNGVSLGEADLQSRLRGGDGHGGAPSADRRKAVLEAMVSQEVLAQKAVSLGLDGDPKYLEAVRAIEIQLATVRRNELAQAYFRHEVAAITVTDAEVRRYWEQNARQLRTEFHIAQILRRDRVSIDEVAAELAAGRVFEEVAAMGYPSLADPNAKPWDLGYLRWQLLPEPWRKAVVKLHPGEASDVVGGENGRFWLLHLIAVRETPDVTFENTAPALKEQLRNQRAAEVREKADREQRAAAKIEYLPATR